MMVKKPASLLAVATRNGRGRYYGRDRGRDDGRLFATEPFRPQPPAADEAGADVLVQPLWG